MHPICRNAENEMEDQKISDTRLENAITEQKGAYGDV
jgi:hypothetical protein